MTPFSDTAHPIPNTQSTSPYSRGSANGSGPVGWVVFMGQILMDLIVHGEVLPLSGGDVWAIDEGMRVGDGFSALVATRRMRVEAVSLSPIGNGPYSFLIQVALTHEEIINLGPRVMGINNRFCIAFTGRTGEHTFISTKGVETMASASAWIDFVRAMNPGDVPCVNGYPMGHPANHGAAEAAPRALPEGVHVILGVPPVIGIPEELPSDNIIVSMNHRKTREVAHQRSRASVRSRCDQPRKAAQGVLAVLDHPVLVRAGAEGAYFVFPAGTAPNARNEDVIHVPMPRVKAIDTDDVGDVHSGVLATFLAQDIPAEQTLLLANCADILSMTVVGPAFCPMHEEIEAAADTLEASNDEE